MHKWEGILNHPSPLKLTHADSIVQFLNQSCQLYSASNRPQKTYTWHCHTSPQLIILKSYPTKRNHMQLVRLTDLIHFHYFPFTIYKSFLVRPSQFKSCRWWSNLYATPCICMVLIKSLCTLPWVVCFHNASGGMVWNTYLNCHIEL